MSASDARLDVEAPIDEVTLTEDRARVVRRGRVELPAGVHRLRIAGVAPVIVDKTVSARLEGGHVQDARVVRRRVVLPEQRAESLRALEEELETTSEASRRMERRLRRIEAALALLERAATALVRELHEDAAWSRADPSGWAERLDALSERERRLREERLGARLELAERGRALSRLRARIAHARTPSDTMSAELHVDVEVPSGEARVLEIDYVVPNACWRPYHRATRDAGRVRFETDGCVWQQTGEDWNDARLRFSTQRPSLGAEPPSLDTDLLRVARRAEVVQVERRDERVEVSGLGAGPRVAPEVPGIDDGGETQELEAAHRAHVKTDGRPHRVALSSFETDAKAELVCFPERVAAVIVKTTQVNASVQPLLAGPVDLIANGGRVGATSILYVAPNERFELGWGPDPSLRVDREIVALDPETSLLRNWHSERTRVIDRLSNLGAAPKVVSLVERVPVSEIEKVKIEVHADETTDGRTPDEDGFVKWRVELAPQGRARVDLVTTLRRHADVVGL